MLKAVIFDFDGVLVESVDIKTKAFRELFKDYPDVLDEFIEYHMINGGVSRFEKIRYFYKTFLGENISEQTLKILCEQYSRLVMDKVIAAPWVAGAPDLLTHCLNRYLMFIVSGTPQEEIQLIAQKRSVDHYFLGVYGSPRTKKDLIRFILAQHHLEPQHVIFIGDSITDLEGAKANRLRFLGRVMDHQESWAADQALVATFKDMTDILPLIKNLNNS